MTISSEVRKAGPFSGNGSTTSFPFDFKVFAASDLVVYLTSPAGVESVLGGSDYAVHLNADQESAPGGTVVKTTPLAAGYLLTITSRLPYLQPVRLTNQGGFYPDVINTALDRLTVFAQQLAEQVGRAVKIKISDSVTPEQLLDGIKADTAAAKGAAAAAAGSASAAGASESAAAGHAQTAQAAASNAQQQAQAAHGSAEVARQAVETITNVGGITPTEADARYVPKSHLSDGDPHSQYANKAQTNAAIAAAQSAATTAGDRIAAHEAFADPHSQYLLKTSAGNLATTNTNQEITAVKQFLCANANIENTTGSLAGLEVRGRGGAAFLAFHRPGAHACYLGIDSDDQLKIGGWSRGAVKYPLLHPTSATAPGNAPCYAPRSWGSFTFNGAGSVSLYALGNVSSVVASTNNTVTVNFIIPMPDGTYAVVFHAHGQPGAYVSSRIAGGFTISGLTGSSNINFAVFR